MNYFVAIPIPAPAGLDECLSGAPSRLSRFHADDLHCTVAFLGPADPLVLPAVAAEVDAIRPPPVNLRFGRLVALPGHRRFSALSFELDLGRRELAELIAAHRDRLIEIGRGRPDRRPPLPHVTVARPPRHLRPDERQQILAWLPEVVPPTSEVAAAGPVLLRSRAHDGRRFEVVDAGLAARLARGG